MDYTPLKGEKMQYDLIFSIQTLLLLNISYLFEILLRIHIFHVLICHITCHNSAIWRHCQGHAKSIIAGKNT